jgi:hypothetical protein
MMETLEQYYPGGKLDGPISESDLEKNPSRLKKRVFLAGYIHVDTFFIYDIDAFYPGALWSLLCWERGRGRLIVH